MDKLPKRAVLYGLVILFALLTALPGMLPADLRDTLPQWYADQHLNLGLDLRGGSYLRLEVDTDQLMLDENRQAADDLDDRLREAGIRHGQAEVASDLVVLSLRGQADLDEAARIARDLSNAATPVRSHDVETRGERLLLRVNPPWRQARLDDAVEQSLEVVRRRLDESGMVEPSITRQGEGGIEVQLPGVGDPARIRELLGTTAKMNFHWLAREGEADPLLLPGGDGMERYPLERRVAMEGRHVKDAQVAYDQRTGEPVVTFRLDGEGGRVFGEMTSANVGRPLAVVLDDRVITAPVIRTPILGGSGEISGGFTGAEAADLAVMLRAGALPAKLDVGNQLTIGPNLGSDAIRTGIASGIAGGLLVLVFMIACYGMWGLLACVGLAVNVLLIFAVLGLLNGTLTLPGIAGIILGVGMAVDANILINERIREETWRGHKAWTALDIGFRRAWATILDSNMTTLIAVSLLFLIGSGPVQGFAVTMGIGLLASLFTAISVTRLLMEWRVGKMGRGRLEMGGIGALKRMSERLGAGGKVIRFMRAGTAGLAISALLSAGSLALMAKPGLEYGIDFTGGAQVQLRADLPLEGLRSAMNAAGMQEMSIQEFGGEGSYLLRLPLVEGEDGTETVEEIKAAVLRASPDAEISGSGMVGSKVSGDFADLSILAVLLAGLGMLGYLWFRFENHFALAAILTIVLDLTKTIGFFVLAGVEFNLTAVAALLALIGYSMNDKVVVFDRVRENLRQSPDLPLEEVLDRSITSTLTRTVLTSGTALVALLPMALFGGKAVESFALPLLFGIVVGTSSSIFIASPILLRLGRRRARKGLPQLQVEEALPAEGEGVRI